MFVFRLYCFLFVCLFVEWWKIRSFGLPGSFLCFSCLVPLKSIVVPYKFLVVTRGDTYQFMLYLIHYLSIHIVFKNHEIGFLKDKFLLILHHPSPTVFICFIWSWMSSCLSNNAFQLDNHCFQISTGFSGILHAAMFVETVPYTWAPCGTQGNFLIWCCSIVIIAIVSPILMRLLNKL